MIRPKSVNTQVGTVKANIKKLGKEYSRLSRAIGVMKTREFDTFTPQGVYDNFIENSFMNASQNKSVNSFQHTPEQNTVNMLQSSAD